PTLPKQVYLRCVLLTSYRFLQTPPLASDALATRIIFPSVGVIQISFNLTSLPASLGKQTKLSTVSVYNFVEITGTKYSIAI
ncbi:hypothetical protein, partial [Photobacterium damselae]|uniref:hypothetical protein n=1 Tax=Photobacterium damselae TaxID=38293 RepID=UPI002F402AA6